MDIRPERRFLWAMKRVYLTGNEPWGAPEFRLGGVGVEEPMAPGFVERPHGMPFWLLVLFHDEAEVRSPIRRERVAEGSLVAWAPGAAHAFGRTEGDWTHSWIYLRGASVDAAMGPLAGRSGEPLPPTAERWLPPLLGLLHGEVTGVARADETWLAAWLVLFRRELARALGDQAPPPRLQRVRALVERELDRPLPIARLATEAGLARSRFIEEFTRFLGVSPAAYVRRERLQRAEHLLLDAGLRIKEVAARSGFADPLHFSRVFRAAHGVPPGEWRRRATGTEAVETGRMSPDPR